MSQWKKEANGAPEDLEDTDEEDVYDDDDVDEYEDDDEDSDDEVVDEMPAEALRRQYQAAAAAAAASGGRIQIPGLEPTVPQSKPSSGAEVKAWKGISKLSGPTLASYQQQLTKLSQSGRKELTIMALGRGGVGTSSTLNSILNEPACVVEDNIMLQSQQQSTKLLQLEAGGLLLRVADVPPLTVQDTIDLKPFKECLYLIKQNQQQSQSAPAQQPGEGVGGGIGAKVDVVLLVHRLDAYRKEQIDKQIYYQITSMFGRDVWDRVVLVFTHAAVPTLPGVSGDNGHGATSASTDEYDTFVRHRVNMVTSEVRKYARDVNSLPVVLVDNGASCPKNGEDQKILPNNQAWLPNLMDTITKRTLQHDAPYVITPEMQLNNSPDKKKRWLIPLLLVAQVLLKIVVIDPLLEEDGCKGNRQGPYEKKEQDKRLRALAYNRNKSKKKTPARSYRR